MDNEAYQYGYYESPIGWIEIIGSEQGILSLEFVDEPHHDRSIGLCVSLAVKQVSEYFRGKCRVFDLPLVLDGTDFQRSVWLHLAEIPFGQAMTYQDIAKAIGKPRAVRAVGAANGRNPISIIVPCHRVIGSDGSLTGYGGGIWRKEWLLKHEGILAM